MEQDGSDGSQVLQEALREALDEMDSEPDDLHDE
jgi:hypothetical protein